MERLTEKHYKASSGYYMRCSEHCERGNCTRCKRLDNIVDKLGQIEDIIGKEYDFDRLREAIEKKDEYEQFMKQWEKMAEIAGAVKKVGAERVAELVEADRQGRVKIYPKSENLTCGACGHFHRIAGTRRGTCDLKPFATTRRGTSWGYVFIASQSRKACKKYEPAVESGTEKGERK